MKGQIALAEPVAAEDSRDLWKITAKLVKRANRQWLCKLPSGATVTVDFSGSDETVTLDFSKCGVVVTGCMNGVPAAGIAMYVKPPTVIPFT